MTPITLLLQGATFGFTAGATPGSLQTYMISETLTKGWRRSFPLIFVPIVSDTPIVILTTFLLGQFPSWVLQIISLVGGFFVLYLAWGLWKQWNAPPTPSTEEPELQHRSFGRAVAINLLNPNPYIFWALVTGPILINAIEQSWLHAFAFLFGFYGVFLATMFATIVLFHQTQRLGPRVVRSVQFISIIILVIFGSVLIKEGLLG